jgi:hypothetical protein
MIRQVAIKRLQSAECLKSAFAAQNKTGSATTGADVGRTNHQWIRRVFLFPALLHLGLHSCVGAILVWKGQ